MAWCRPGNKPLSEPMMVNLPTHICVTWPQWVKQIHHWNGKSNVVQYFNVVTFIVAHVYEYHFKFMVLSCETIFHAWTMIHWENQATFRNFILHVPSMAASFHTYIIIHFINVKADLCNDIVSYIDIYWYWPVGTFIITHWQWKLVLGTITKYKLYFLLQNYLHPAFISALLKCFPKLP